MRFLALIALLLPSLSHASAYADRPYTTPQDASSSVRALGLELRKKGDTRALFPLVYSLTIQSAERQLARGAFRNSAWVTTLIVNYANLYRRTIQAELAGKRRTLPAGWQVEFDRSNYDGWSADADIVYGIHVHIARDLVEALLITPTNFASPSVRADFFQITEALQETMPEIWNVFLSYSSTPRLLPGLEKSVMMTWIAELRARAWDQAVAASRYNRSAQSQFLRELDAKVARRSLRHGVLLPVLRF